MPRITVRYRLRKYHYAVVSTWIRDYTRGLLEATSMRLIIQSQLRGLGDRGSKDGREYS